MAFRSLLGSAKRLVGGGGAEDGNSRTASAATELFPATDPAVDGDDCAHDCEGCTTKYPRGFKVEGSDRLYGHVKGWSTHVLVATGKTDWVRDVADEKGSVMQAFDRAARKPAHGRTMLSASNIPVPHGGSGYDDPTTVLVLPAFRFVEDVRPADVDRLIDWIDTTPTSTTPLSAPPAPAPEAAATEAAAAPQSIPAAIPAVPGAEGHLAAPLLTRACPHAALVLLCSQATRDARCGQSAPLIRRELERHLRPLGLMRDLDDARPGGVGIYFISHVGGHKYSANVMIYRRPDAFGLDGVARAQLGPEERDALRPRAKPAAAAAAKKETNGENGVNGDAEKKAEEDEDEDEDEDPGANQCIWLARVRPEDCENLVKYTILQGKVVKPDTQLRGGFDRSKGLLSW